MEWIADVSAGDWLRERLDDQHGTMHGVVPRGFSAYARIFHPPQVRSLPDRPVPEAEEWMRMPEVEQHRLTELFTDGPTTWSAAADAFGTTMHAHAQWQRIVRTPVDGDWRSRIAPDGREFTCPDEGQMPPELLAGIVAHLVAHTSTPDDGFAAVWEGWGDLVGGMRSGNASAALASDEPRHAAVLQQSIHDLFNNPFRRAKWHPGILSDEISKGPRFELPDRNHVLFSAAPRVFTGADWILSAPWRDRRLEQLGRPPQAQHPSILWPADHSWVLVSEIDFDSTVVAGSADLVRAICTDEAIEALPIREDADLTWAGDSLNH